MNAPQTWTVTPTQYAALVSMVRAAGIPLTGYNGTVSKDGVVLEETYDGTTLSITVESRAWYDPDIASIQAKIAGAIKAALGS